MPSPFPWRMTFAAPLSDAGPSLRMADLPNERVSPLFQAAIEAAEEAILNSLFKATTIIGHNGFVGEALPLDRVMDLIDEKGGQARIQACPRRRVDE